MSGIVTYVDGLDTAAVVKRAGDAKARATLEVANGEPSVDDIVKDREDVKYFAHTAMMLVAEIHCLREANRAGQEARNILAALAERTHKSETTGFGVRDTGLGVDLTAEVLLAMIEPAENLVSFKIERKGADVAIVTIQRPTGKTPIELLRAAKEKIAALEAEIQTLRAAPSP